MENKPDQNLFRQVHRKVQDLRESARKNRDEAERRSQRTAEDDTVKESFDPPAGIPEAEDKSQ